MVTSKKQKAISMRSCLSLLLGLCLALNSCTQTIQDRIEERPAIFQSSTPEQQAEIQAGRISNDFTPEQVYLVFGKPSRTEIGQMSDDTRFEDWYYRDIRLVGTYYRGYNYPIRIWHRRDAHWYDEGYSYDEYAYFNRIFVRFINGKVDKFCISSGDN